ncbi:MAG TPA: MCE family protein [Pseudonocardiaceae bacterium]|jgi:phospholipid/cholesterol/gamma-HCH transport system substrate-binding protein|nr:MCE family protein [Pseudonocardiaceae bacterium]
MITRKVLIQVLVFAVVGVLAVGYTAMRYGGIGSSIINPGYDVKLDLASGGGIFTNSEVTYRGVTVGKVTSMQLTRTGLEVDMHINDSAPQIPADLTASVADRSAVGEQYVDLVPNTDSGPFLADGSTIEQRNTVLPLPTNDLLTNLNGLANSVPVGSLQTVVNELDNGFSGTGPDLQKLLDTVSDFTKTAQSQLPETTQLLDSGKVVLDTQVSESGAIESFSTSLNQLSQQLKTSDPDIRNLISNAPLAGQQITDLLTETGPQLGSLLANLLTTANVLVTRTSGLEEAMVAYPVLAGAAGTVITSDGKAKLGLALNLFDPPPCTNGYQGTQHRPANDTSPATLNLNAYCNEGPNSPIDVRGAQNAPYGGNPGSAVSSGGAGQQTPSSTNTSGSGLVATGQSVPPISLAQLLGV